MATVVTEHVDRPGTRTREIGPIGTVSRVAVGLAALVLPIVFEGLGWWDVLGWVGLTVLATAASRAVLGASGGYARDGRRGLGAWSAATCFLAALLLGASVAIAIWTPAHGDVVLWGFLGLSMLVAAVRGDAGCEVLAFPNAILRRRDRVGCIIFTPIDAAEARRNTSATASHRPTDEGTWSSEF